MIQKYSNQDKQGFINRYLSGEPAISIISQNNIPRSTFYSWIKSYTEKPKPISLKSFRGLESKIAKLESMVRILQNTPFTDTIPLREKLDYAEALYEKYSVRCICEALQIPRGTFYNHIFRSKRNSPMYEKRRDELCDKIQEVFYDNRQIYGARKITAVLRNNGEHISEKVVLDLMREMGISSICDSAKSAYLKNKRNAMPNLVKQEFYTDAPNKVWVGDVTYYKSPYGKSYYICVVLDLFSRKIIGYKISLRNNTQLINSTFKQAYENRKPTEKLIFHNDRGTNYRSASFRNYLKSLGVEHSFSKAHVPYDNAVVERFFRTLKDDELYRGEYRSEMEFRNAIDDYMLFYNEKRLHGTLGDKTPNQLEEEFFSKLNTSSK